MYPSVDNWPVWSHDGRWIAYQRRFPSTDGPAGLYIINADGGTPRFLAQGGFWDPSYIRFSPDDRYLSCVRGFQLLIVDLLTGTTLEPMFTNHGIAAPDWSPDGTTIAYHRFASHVDDPPESLGVHFFDLRTGIDRTLIYQDTTKYGGFPVWSEDGQEIALSDRSEDWLHHRIVAVRVDGSGLRTLVATTHGLPLQNLRSFDRPARGMKGLVFGGTIDIGGGAFFVRWDGTGLTRMPRTYRSEYRYSPDGEWAVGSGFDASDSLAVLFVFRADDLTGASRRQLTRYVPPVENSARIATH
jgi:Tol biopolymer transport system component